MAFVPRAFVLLALALHATPVSARQLSAVQKEALVHERFMRTVSIKLRPAIKAKFAEQFQPQGWILCPIFSDEFHGFQRRDEDRSSSSEFVFTTATEAGQQSTTVADSTASPTATETSVSTSAPETATPIASYLVSTYDDPQTSSSSLWSSSHQTVTASDTSINPIPTTIVQSNEPKEQGSQNVGVHNCPSATCPIVNLVRPGEVCIFSFSSIFAEYFSSSASLAGHEG